MSVAGTPQELSRIIGSRVCDEASIPTVYDNKGNDFNKNTPVIVKPFKAVFSAIIALKKFMADRRINSWVAFFALIYIVLLVKLITIRIEDMGIFFKVYSVSVSCYILSRFVIAYFFEEDHPRFMNDYEPTVSFGIPAKNEGENIRETILRIADSDYPKDKFDIIVVNDGSDDNTLEEMRIAGDIAKERGVNVIVVDWVDNKGKREGMAECVRRSNHEIVVFIDSDSFVEADTARNFVKFFSDKKVGAVAGHAYVANKSVNMLTRMQAARYFVAFKAYKGAEALFGTVICCSGCCSAYRREYVSVILEEWLNQEFLGVKCTYGDDRSLTNMLLKNGYKTLFTNHAIAHTFVPESIATFMKQQLRWKKSWVRESLIASKFMWKKHPLMSTSFYMGIILTFFAPIAVLRAVLWYPYTTGEFPIFYILGLILMAAIYGIYYNIFMRDRYWIYGIVFALFYTLVLIWQLPYAILTIRDSRWGTR
jgi:hyaluronan synthase